MSLTCDHFDGYGDDCAWYYEMSEDQKPLETKRGRRCCSCGCLIKVGELSTKYTRYRPPKNDIEERIHGDGPDAVYMASQYLCESCGDLAENLKELGYCTPPGDDMRELVKEYAEMTQQERKAA